MIRQKQVLYISNKNISMFILANFRGWIYSTVFIYCVGVSLLFSIIRDLISFEIII